MVRILSRMQCKDYVISYFLLGIGVISCLGTPCNLRLLSAGWPYKAEDTSYPLSTQADALATLPRWNLVITITDLSHCIPLTDQCLQPLQGFSLSRCHCNEMHTYHA